jgi:hypothetical protein
MAVQEKLRMLDDTHAVIEQMRSVHISGSHNSLSEVESMFATTAELLQCLETLSEKLHRLECTKSANCRCATCRSVREWT